jgi:hypothetical protein
MKPLIKLKTTTILFIPLALACFALLPSARAFTTDPDETFPNFNTAAGLEALLFTTGASNTAYGARALRANTTGGSNLGIGGFALINNTDGNMNTAVGNNAMFHNLHGDNNMALGQGALATNTDGNNNVAMGAQALNRNTASNNVGVGFQALLNNTVGTANNALGFSALITNVGAVGTGDQNNAFGTNALASNAQGRQNSSFGDNALQFATGSRNTAVGNEAGTAVTTGSFNVYLGDNAGSNFNHANESNTIRIGSDTGFGGIDPTRCFIHGIFGVVPPAGSHFVLVAPSGQFSDFSASSRRFKKDIAPIDKISEGVLALKPVTFHYKNDNTNEPEFGLVAEDVVEVNPDWITRDREGEIFGVRYEVIPILLLNEFLKEHKKVEEQQSKIDTQQASIAELKATVAQQAKGMEVLTAQLKEQAAQIQRVSAQVEMSKTAPRTVASK